MTIASLTRTAATAAALAVLAIQTLPAQEKKPVPKDSARVAIPGCTKGYIFTAGPKTPDEPGSFEIPEGMHLRMNAPKKLMKEIKDHEGERLEIVGLVKKGQYREGVNISKGVRIAPAPGGGGVAAGMGPGATTAQTMIDVEGWRPLAGSCPR